MSRERVVFIPSKVHEGHYVYINGESTGMVVNLFAYKTIKEYEDKVNNDIKKLLNNEQ